MTKFPYQWLLITTGVVVVILGVGLAALSGGLFVGYQWGHARGLATALERRVEALPRDLTGPFEFGEGGPLGDLAARPYLGVEFEMLTPELAEAEGLKVDEGALIRAVRPASPAEAAGLRAGDIVQKVNGQAVDADHTLRDRIAGLEPSDTVTLTVRRGADTLTLEATLGVWPVDGRLGAPFGEGNWPPGFRFRFECPPQPCTLQPCRPAPHPPEPVPTD